MHCLLEFQLRYSDVSQEVPLQSCSSADLSLNNGWCFDVNFIGGCSAAPASMMGISRRIYPQHYLLIHIKETGQSKCGWPVKDLRAPSRMHEGQAMCSTWSSLMKMYAPTSFFLVSFVTMCNLYCLPVTKAQALCFCQMKLFFREHRFWQPCSKRQLTSSLTNCN